MSVKLLPALLLALASGVSAFQTDATVLTVTIRPAVSLTVDAASVAIKIRLAPESAAQIWRSDDCGLLPSNGYTISRSGTYQIPLDEINGRGSRICMASTDGAIAATAAISMGLR